MRTQLEDPLAVRGFPKRGQVGDPPKAFPFLHPLHPEVQEVPVQDRRPLHGQGRGAVILLLPHRLARCGIAAGALQGVDPGLAEGLQGEELPAPQLFPEFFSELRPQAGAHQVVGHLLALLSPSLPLEAAFVAVAGLLALSSR